MLPRYRSSGLMKVDDQPNLHVERYLGNSPIFNTRQK